MEVIQYVVKDTNRFLKGIEQLLPDNISSFTIMSFDFRSKGTGCYEYVLEVDADGDRITLKEQTNDSLTYDEYRRMEYKSRTWENFVKSKILSMVEDNYYELKERD